MSHNYSLTTFSSSGKLGGIDHALAAVSAGATALAIKTPSGVVICTEKKVSSPLYVISSIRKTHQVDDHVGVTFAGQAPDARVMIKYAQKQCQIYRLEYGAPIPVRMLAQFISQTFQQYTYAGGVRPFGCSLLLAGWDSLGPHLYLLEPSGACVPMRASTIGNKAGNVRTDLEKLQFDSFAEAGGTEDAILAAVQTIKSHFDGRLTETSLELGFAGKDGFRILPTEEVKGPLPQLCSSPRRSSISLFLLKRRRAARLTPPTHTQRPL